jgi:hypothetical protein
MVSWWDLRTVQADVYLKTLRFAANYNHPGPLPRSGRALLSILSLSWHLGIPSVRAGRKLNHANDAPSHDPLADLVFTAPPQSLAQIAKAWKWSTMSCSAFLAIVLLRKSLVRCELHECWDLIACSSAIRQKFRDGECNAAGWSAICARLQQYVALGIAIA